MTTDKSPEYILQAIGVSRRVAAPAAGPVADPGTGMGTKLAPEVGGADLTIVDDVSLAVCAGEAVAIVGPSGSGKSTLLGMLAGLDDVSSGAVWLDGQALASADEDSRARLRAGRVGFVFQAFHLLPGLTALENVILPLELARSERAPARALAMLAALGLAERRHHYPRQLSGGEQQRVALARAFVVEPRILFADEPTGNLDQHNSEQIANAMFELRRDKRTTLVLVTHDRQLAQRCDRVLTMVAGAMRPQDRANT